MAIVVLLILITVVSLNNSADALYKNINITSDSNQKPENHVILYEFNSNVSLKGKNLSNFLLDEANLDATENKLLLLHNNSIIKNEFVNLEIQIKRDILDSKNFSKDVPFRVHVGGLELLEEIQKERGLISKRYPIPRIIERYRYRYWMVINQ